MAKTPQYIKDFIDSLNHEDLHALYHAVVERLNLLNKARAILAMKDLEIMDRVFFVDEGKRIEGVISRLNQRTVSVITDDKTRWTVSPNLVTKIAEPNPLKQILAKNK